MYIKILQQLKKLVFLEASLSMDTFKLIPQEPTTETKIMIIRDKEPSNLPLSILGWRRILPNKVGVAVQNRQPIAYQCTALDNNCCIEVSISYKIHDKVISRSLATSPVMLSKQLKQRSLYVMQPMQCRISIDQFSVFMKVCVDSKRIRFLSDNTKFQMQITQHLVEIQPYHFFAKINFTQLRNDFLHFYCSVLKWTPKFKSNYCYCIFHSKLQQDLFLVAISDCFKQNVSSTAQIKIISNVHNKTPRNDKDKERDRQLKKDGSTSSIASNNKSRQKNKEKEKVKISQRLNLKRSCTKLSGNSRLQKQQRQQKERPQKYGGNLGEGQGVGLDKSDKLDTTTTRECLNIFEEDDQFDLGSSSHFHNGNHNPAVKPTRNANSNTTSNEQPSMILKQSDISMDLRGSFEELQQKSQDKLSNHSLKQKNTITNTNINNKTKSMSLQEENKQLKQQNMRLRRQLQVMSISAREATSIRKEYLKAVQQLNRSQNEKSAIMADKIKFQSGYYKQLQEKQAIKKQLEGIKNMTLMAGHGQRINMHRQ